MMDGMKRCGLCGIVSIDVAMSMAKWNLGLKDQFYPDGKTPILGADTPPFGSIERCKDPVGCRARVEAEGDPWLIDDTPAGAIPRPRWSPSFETAAAGRASSPDDPVLGLDMPPSDAADPGPESEAAPSTMFD